MTFGNGINSIELFRDLELVIRRGERIAIVGSSGAGKSTLLNILGTLEKPTGGKVLYGGEDVFLWGERELANFRNRNIGFVFQFHYLLPEFNALENVMMPGLISGLARAEAKSRAEDLLDRLGLSAQAQTPGGRAVRRRAAKSRSGQGAFASPEIVFGR